MMESTDIVSISVNCMIILILAAAIITDLTSKSKYNYPYSFRVRRTLNWLIIGIAYSFQVSCKYSLYVFNTSSGRELLSINRYTYQFLTSSSLWVYAITSIIAGVIIEKVGGKRSFVMALAFHSFLALWYGGLVHWQVNLNGFVPVEYNFAAFIYLMGTNILQTFGAIVPLQVGASWYEKEDRGLISGILGVTTGVGYLLGFGVNGMLLKFVSPSSVFFVPGVLMGLSSFICYFWSYNSPEEAGFSLKSYHTSLESPDNSKLKINLKEERATQIQPPVAKTKKRCNSTLSQVSDTEYIDHIDDKSMQNIQFSPGIDLFEDDESKILVPKSKIIRDSSQWNLILRLFKAVPFSLWIHCLCMFIMGLIRDAFFAYINDFISIEFNAGPGSLVASLIAASITVGSVTGALLSGYISSLTSKNLAIGGCMTVFMALFANVVNVYAVIVFSTLSSISFFGVKGLSRTVSLIYGGPKRAAFVGGLLGFSQFIGGGFGCIILGTMVHSYSYYSGYMAMVFLSVLGSVIYVYMAYINPVSIQQ